MLSYNIKKSKLNDITVIDSIFATSFYHLKVLSSTVVSFNIEISTLYDYMMKSFNIDRG